ncbi:hypothetical protein AMS68_000448 [Peltaster fructicola]|uniref:Ribosomal protein L9 domain-containing protein n=1 Tax=Peltaster fructicola TaxID=286661 RepID=A0A6H0XJV6_9PEZI|nr:hypothetical protein AMS68_000448 [Peltaster fructicola]
MRSYALGILREARPALGGLEHVRGKKKKSTRGPLSIPVRLKQDLPGFGAKGTIIPVAAGRMRNNFFPKGIAEYITITEKSQLRRSQTPIERDFAFGQEIQEVEEEEEVIDAPVLPKRIEVKSITPERGMQLLEIFIPQRLDFYRQAIIEPEPEVKPTPSARKSGLSDVAADLLAVRAEANREAEKEAKSKQLQAIYGSVSTHDVYEALKARMAQNDESSRVVFDESAVVFTSPDVDAEDRNKLKTVGTFSYEIKLKGAETAISRTVKVIAQSA